MRNYILSFIILTALPAGVFAGEAKILSLSGAVEVRPTREGQWTSASKDMEIAEGGGVRTGADGGAVVQLPNKSKVWLKESTALEIEQRQTLASRLALVFGRIKVRVPHLMRKEKFEVRTPSAICAVRGTEFTMGTTEDGKMDLKVLFGEVKFKFNVPPAKGKAEFSIPQGQGLETRDDGKPAAPALLTAKAEREAMEDWNPGLKPDERQKGLIQKDNDRAQIKDYAKTTASAENTVKNFLNVVKESDLEAGRTLTDVHGNLVRVDQRMVRPDGNTIQFMNLVKRPVYANYAQAANGFAYNGGAVSNRLDLAQMSMGFNQELPQRIDEWPSFFNGNDVDPTYASFILANRTDASDIFFVAEGFRYDAARDELVDNLSVFAPNRSWAASSSNDLHTMITGVLQDGSGAGESAQAMLNAISRLEIKDLTIVGGADASAGNLQYLNPVSNTYVNMDSVGGSGTDVDWGMLIAGAHGYSYNSDADNAPLANFQADAYAVGNDISNSIASGGIIWYAREDYVINNGGGIRTVDSVTSSSEDPFTLLKNLAVQSVVYVKKDTGSNWTNNITSDAIAKVRVDNSSTGDWFAGGRNIDVVIIPDLFVAGIQRMLPAFTNLSE